MAPQVGFEPTTDRLTADCSTTELLWNSFKSPVRFDRVKCIKEKITQRRPTFAGGEPPTIIGAGELNFRVRHGNGCDLSAFVTRLCYFRLLKTFYILLYHSAF
jgi:hypothetical protein